MNRTPLRDVLTVTKALADGQRVRILLLLQAGELCVCQIVEVLGLANSTVSKHLSLLAAAGLVDLRKDGRWAYYRIAGGAEKTLLGWLDRALRGDPDLARDAKKLAVVKKKDLEVLCRQQRRN